MPQVHGLGRVVLAHQQSQVLQDDVGVVVSFQEPVVVLEVMMIQVLERLHGLGRQMLSSVRHIQVLDVGQLDGGVDEEHVTVTTTDPGVIHGLDFLQKLALHGRNPAHDAGVLSELNGGAIANRHYNNNNN